MRESVVRFVGAAVVGALALAGTTIEPNARIFIGVIIGLTSFVLLIVSRRQLGTSFSIMPEAKGLVSVGLYSRIQHPLYFFLDMILIGIIVALGLPLLLAAWGILVVVHLIQCRREEKVLADAFGRQYEEYKKQTWF